MFSIQKLNQEYKSSINFSGKHLVESIFVGSFANVFYTKCSVGSEAKRFLKMNVMEKLKVEYVSSYKGVLVKKSSKSVKILGNFKGFSFYKTFMLDSPMTLTLGITPRRLYFSKKSNIFSLFKPGHKFYKKVKKIK